VLSCRAAESEARLSYAALGDLFDLQLPDLPSPQKRALDAALLRAEVEDAPPDQRAVSVASLGALRALAASGLVIVAIDDVQAAATPHARRSVHRRLADLVVDLEERARHLALAASGPDLHVAHALEEAGRHVRWRSPGRRRRAAGAGAEADTARGRRGAPQSSVEAAEYHFDAGDATRATALLEEAIATARPGRDRARILLNQASISWLDLPASKGAASKPCRRQRRTPGSEPRPMSTWPG
jgi:hypothetical protein